MKLIKFAVPMLLGLMVVACDKESHGPSRTFYMGFTPMPYEASVDAVHWTYQKLAEDADIINHHLDNGVPWVEALMDAPYSTNIMNDWAFRKNNSPAGHRTIVSICALNLERNGLARYRGEKDEMPLPSPWDTYQFDSQEVKTAYLNYCKRAITYFNPDYFNMNIEANLLYFTKPSLWNGFLSFHQYIYDQLKLSFPSLVIYSSVTGAQLLEGFIGGNDYVQQRLAALQILEHSDLYGISFYPYMSKYLGDSYPKDSFDKLFTLSDKPLAIAETGYPAQTFPLNTGVAEVTVASDEQKQDTYVSELLTASEKYHAKFVIIFAVRDYDALWQALGAKTDLTIAWRDTGLYDENAKQRLAYLTWKKFLGWQYNP